MEGNFDFSGYATRNDLKCSDGRTIRKNAFAHCDGMTVPLVWNHQHDDVDNVLGHALLENREDGVYAYGTFNDTPAGQNAKLMVQHGDIKALSIYANKLKQNGMDVLHGAIREVSLVLAGANPGAYIENVEFAHGEYTDEDAVIYTGEDFVLAAEESVEHACKEEKKEEPVKMAAEEEKKTSVEATEEKENDSEETAEDVLKTLSEKQMKVVGYIIDQAVKDAKAEKAEAKHSDEGGEEEMKHNVFDAETNTQDQELMHAGLATIIKDGKRFGSLKESFLAHTQDYGIENIDWLFPDAKNLSNEPGFVKRNPDQWVSVVMNGVHHTPFARIKMLFADLREDDARAKGYATKGALKKEEVFGLLKRTVTPTTIYKKQKLDRDDIIDITDFNVVAWLKGEMRMMLDEEIARAILFGDGRTSSSPDKISETNIIPIAKDASLYTITQSLPSTYTAKDVIIAAVKGQNNYEGSGNTVMFVANSLVTDMLLLEDGENRRYYKDVTEVALACSVNRIVKVPDSIVPTGVKALIVDLNDYNVGADKGGAVNMFDDFDIDYNQEKYLIETRCSGALTKPFSAVVVKEAVAAG